MQIQKSWKLGAKILTLATLMIGLTGLTAPAFASEVEPYVYLGEEDLTAEEMDYATEDWRDDRGGRGGRDDRRWRVCDPVNQPWPHWGERRGRCLKSCGSLGGTHSFSTSCDRYGMVDMGEAYDVPYCCARRGGGRRW
jgi:hypothetical protein